MQQRKSFYERKKEDIKSKILYKTLPSITEKIHSIKQSSGTRLNNFCNEKFRFTPDKKKESMD